jgi:hypothetical protein
LQPDVVIWLWGSTGSFTFKPQGLRFWSLGSAVFPGFLSQSRLFRDVGRFVGGLGWGPSRADLEEVIEQAKNFSAENGTVLAMSLPSDANLTLPSEVQVGDPQRRFYHFLSPSNSGRENTLWDASDHERRARVVEKYILVTATVPRQ